MYPLARAVLSLRRSHLRLPHHHQKDKSCVLLHGAGVGNWKSTTGNRSFGNLSLNDGETCCFKPSTGRPRLLLYQQLTPSMSEKLRSLFWTSITSPERPLRGKIFPILPAWLVHVSTSLLPAFTKAAIPRSSLVAIGFPAFQKLDLIAIRHHIEVRGASSED